MKLTIDCREKHLIEEIQKLKQRNPHFENIELDIKQLDLGDVSFIKEDKEILIIERKTIQDLLASIKDGRYEEQSLRLGNLPISRHNIIYLIEGKMLLDLTLNKTLYSSICSLFYYKGFSVLRTFNCEETAFLLCQMYCKLLKTTDKVCFHNLNENLSRENVEKNPEKSYGEVIKKVKKENITKENIGAIMLSQIPNVSYTIASLVLEKFETIQKLCNEIEKDKNCLNNLQMTDAKGKVRKVNKTSIKNIIDFLE